MKIDCAGMCFPQTATLILLKAERSETTECSVMAEKKCSSAACADSDFMTALRRLHYVWFIYALILFQEADSWSWSKLIQTRCHHCDNTAVKQKNSIQEALFWYIGSKRLRFSVPAGITTKADSVPIKLEKLINSTYNILEYLILPCVWANLC